MFVGTALIYCHHFLFVCLFVQCHCGDGQRCVLLSSLSSKLLYRMKVNWSIKKRKEKKRKHRTTPRNAFKTKDQLVARATVVMVCVEGFLTQTRGNTLLLLKWNRYCKGKWPSWLSLVSRNSPAKWSAELSTFSHNPLQVRIATTQVFTDHRRKSLQKRKCTDWAQALF